MTAPARADANLTTRRLVVGGVVQGVGFRPFVHRLAKELGIGGWVRNDGYGVTIEAEGTEEAVSEFVVALRARRPKLARIDFLEQTEVAAAGSGGVFEIRESLPTVNDSRLVLSPDSAICDDCLRELRTPSDRRFGHPLITCTNCGPRYAFALGVPYDRCNTTMHSFPLCELCEREYRDVTSRRYHAQSISCWSCGPSVSVLDAAGERLTPTDPIAFAADQLRIGAILAVKGIGGYHIMVDPTNDAAVDRLRTRKKRPHKPFALVCGDLDAAREVVDIEPGEGELLDSIARPIVLLPKRPQHGLSDRVAPTSTYFGVMLASTPLQHLLLEQGFRTLIATSGNMSGGSILFEDGAALKQLSKVVDYFLIHDRVISIGIDDSVLRPVRWSAAVSHLDRTRPTLAPLRRARGYAPLPLRHSRALPPVLAVGAELKNTICVARDESLFVSEHVGDLKEPTNYERFLETSSKLCRLIGVEPTHFACDGHPMFRNSRYARERGQAATILVQHHHAHVASCMCEHGVRDPVIGVAFDGAGYGPDGTAWGGEFLVADLLEARRMGRVRRSLLLGGDRAAREPYRMMLALLLSMDDRSVLDLPVPALRRVPIRDLDVLTAMHDKRINSVATSSVGRLFDAAAALLDMCQVGTFEGHAATVLEDAIEATDRLLPTLPFDLSTRSGGIELDMRPTFRALAELVAAGRERVGVLSGRFHSTLVHATSEVVARIAVATGIRVVVLTGGVFANAFLLRHCHTELSRRGFTVLTHRDVPAGDGGLSLGQAVVAGERVLAGKANVPLCEGMNGD